MPSSYNGWPASPNPADISVDPGFRAAGVAFPGGVRAGDVSTMLRYVADQMLARVEPLVLDPSTGKPGYGCWGFNYRANANNPNNLSNHSSGTAIDWNATLHPNGKRGTFSSAQVASIRAILAECSGAVMWGGDFTGTPDEMHFDIQVNASRLATAVKSLPGGGVSPSPLPPIPPGVNMPLIVRRADEGAGLVDFAWDDALRVIIRIPSSDYYALLQAAKIIDPDCGHGSAETVGFDLVEWLQGQVVGAGGTDYRPER